MFVKISKHFKTVKPWLHITHRNFFLIYACTAITHLWVALNGLLGQDDDFLAPALVEVNKFADHTTWGWVSLFIGLGLVGGLFLGTFVVSRVFLGFGTAIMIFRFLLIAQAWESGQPVGNTLPYLFLIIGLHISQTLEPPLNPETSKIRHG